MLPKFNFDMGGFYDLYEPISSHKIRMPAKKKNGEYNYIINKKVAVVYWDDGSKTIIRKTAEDEHNKRIAFLTAFFQKYCGLSRNKANKFLASLKDEDDIKEEKDKE